MGKCESLGNNQLAITSIVFLQQVSGHSNCGLCVYFASQGKHSLGLMWWLLCREVLRLRGTISRELAWEVMADLFFYREPEEVCMCVSVCVCVPENEGL